MPHSYAGAMTMAETHAAEKPGFTVSSSPCKRYFGYLSQREKGAAMPDDCLTCEKMLDCMFSKPDNPAAIVEKKPEPEPEPEIQEMPDEEPVAEETINKPVIVAHPDTFEDEVEREQERAPILTLETYKPIEPEKPTAKPIVPTRSDEEFIVETPGQLYNQWSGTVLVNKETLQSLGKKVKEVEIQTQHGIRVKCKVFAIADMRFRAIQIPNKLKSELEVDDGDYVKVTPK
jgi:hypothetical protein